MVVPGTYQVTAFKRIGDETTQLGDPVTFQVESIIDPTLELADRKEVLEYQFQVAALQQSVTALSTTLNEALESVRQAKTLISDGRDAPLSLMDDARALELKLLDAAEKLNGDGTKQQRSASTMPSISSRIGNALFSTLRGSYGPTKD